jgi:nucleoside-diphosphate-sugar epimerase
MGEFVLPPGDGKKICVGGGAGFIGSHIAKRMKEAGYYVVGELLHLTAGKFFTAASICK